MQSGRRNEAFFEADLRRRRMRSSRLGRIRHDRRGLDAGAVELLRDGAMLLASDVRGIYRLADHGALPRIDQNAFVVLGVPTKIMVDNLRSAVLKRLIRRGDRFQPTVRGFCTPSGLQNRSLQRGRGQRKDIRSLARRGRHDRIVIRAQVEQIARTVAQVPEECW